MAREVLARLTTRLRVGGADRFGDCAVVDRDVGDVAHRGAAGHEVVCLARDHSVTDQAFDDLLAARYRAVEAAIEAELARA